MHTPLNPVIVNSLRKAIFNITEILSFKTDLPVYFPGFYSYIMVEMWNFNERTRLDLLFSDISTFRNFMNVNYYLEGGDLINLGILYNTYLENNIQVIDLSIARAFQYIVARFQNIINTYINATLTNDINNVLTAFQFYL